jgi:hypothetical protein
MKARLYPMLLLVLAPLAAGCATGKDETAKQLDELKKEVVALRASYAGLRDQLDSMGESAVAAEEKGGDADAEEQPGDRPSLEVVHLSPEEEPGAAPPPVAAAPVDEGPPIVIRGDESGVEQVDADAEDAKPGNKHVGKPVVKQTPKGR